ncbi:glycosyltransferase family 2 protein [Listeria booriae]|uniref:Glycosyltransferase family 2 protein n=1 Tax=Listeria booriae TaxID=1552123 RepID=A0A7X1CMW2_9LIST|nr:glycosyltransferase family 2 protein [Listeria booriae]MBC1794712.1 glycosyltransferase family 2 protein [Listeria booriae]MBC1803063.1 glycosyltransferase family 2 protein [Listeria booriae]
MKEKLVSVIIPTYNSEATIAKTISSVLNQSYKSLEIIIVDDASNDKTVQIIQDIDKSQISLFVLKQNIGAAEARNVALSKARGRFIAFLDSDDTWYPEKLARQLRFMEEHQAGFSFTAYERVVASTVKNTVQVPRRLAYNDLLRNTIINCSTVVIDRKRINHIKMPSIRTRQDTATWLSILKKGHVAYGLNQVLASYNLRNDSLSSKKGKMAMQTWKMYREQEKLSYWHAAICFTCYAYNAVRKRII